MLAILDTALESKWHVRAEVMTPRMPNASTHVQEWDRTRCAEWELRGDQERKGCQSLTPPVRPDALMHA